MKDIRESMQRHSGPVDVVIVGSGAAGSTLAARLSKAGLSVVVLEAGRWFDTRDDFQNDELAMLGPLDWDDLRISEGSDPLALGRMNTGRAIGGSTVHFTAVKLRLHEDDFQMNSRYGAAVDWPFHYSELEPYYSEAEDFVGISGPRDFPWGPFKGPYGQGELPLQAADELLAAGMDKLGIQWRQMPHAILTAAREGRSPCMFYGFCVSGCKSGAKGSALVTWVPAAVKSGAEFRDGCFATRVVLSESGKARGVVYLREGREEIQEAAIVIVSCYSIETPRLLLNSAEPRCPQGLANSSGQVGKNLMVHPATEVQGRFVQPVDQFIGPPVGIVSQDFYRSATEGGPGGYTINRYSHFPIDFAQTLLTQDKGLWGRRLHETMDSYTHWAGLAAMCEQLPSGDNRVTLADEVDQHGVRVAKVSMNYSGQDRALMSASRERLELIMRAAGALETRYCEYADHVLGTCRMGNDSRDAVVDPWCRSFDVDNLFICDGSVFPTAGAVNPSLTIEAIALRTAEHISRYGPLAAK